MTILEDSVSAAPTNITEREPPLPPPNVIWSLSPSTMRMRSKRHAEHVGQHLRISRRVPLAEVHRAGDDGHHAVGLEMDGAQFLAGRGGDFQIAADAEAAQQPAFLAVALALVEALVVGHLQRVLEQRGKSPQS